MKINGFIADDALTTRIETMAAQRGITKSDVLRSAVARYLEAEVTTEHDRLRDATIQALKAIKAGRVPDLGILELARDRPVPEGAKQLIPGFTGEDVLAFVGWLWTNSTPGDVRRYLELSPEGQVRVFVPMLAEFLRDGAS